MSDFTTVPITNLLDYEGDEVDDHEDAVTFVAKVNEAVWIVDLVNNYETVPATMN